MLGILNKKMQKYDFSGIKEFFFIVAILKGYCFNNFFYTFQTKIKIK